jgi:hypothetical protein
VKILVDDAVALAKRREIEAVVRAVIGERAGVDELLVSVLKLEAGRGWSVFLSESEGDAHALVDEIERALRGSGL